MVVADLHSALPAVLAGSAAGYPAPVAMTDGGALPAWYSRTVARLRAAGWLAAMVTGRPGLWRRRRSRHPAHGPARGAPRPRCRRRRRRPGTGQSRQRHPVGLLRRRMRRGGQRHGHPRRSVCGVVAHQRSRSASGIAISHHSLTAYGRVALAPVEVVVPELGDDLDEVIQSRWGRSHVTGSSPSLSTGCWTRFGGRR